MHQTGAALCVCVWGNVLTSIHPHSHMAPLRAGNGSKDTQMWLRRCHLQMGGMGEGSLQSRNPQTHLVFVPASVKDTVGNQIDDCVLLSVGPGRHDPAVHQVSRTLADGGVG